MNSVHVAITRRVKPGLEIEFMEALKRFAHASLQEPGTLGVNIIRPLSDAENSEFGIIRSFENEEACQKFYNSNLYKDWKEHVRELVVDAPELRRLSGLESFFQARSENQPKRWKMALVTWMGVNFTALILTFTLSPIIALWPFSLRFVTFNAGVVAGLTWLVMPVLVRWSNSWLRR